MTGPSIELSYHGGDPPTGFVDARGPDTQLKKWYRHSQKKIHHGAKGRPRPKPVAYDIKSPNTQARELSTTKAKCRSELLCVTSKMPVHELANRRSMVTGRSVTKASPGRDSKSPVSRQNTGTEEGLDTVAWDIKGRYPELGNNVSMAARPHHHSKQGNRDFCRAAGRPLQNPI